MSWTKKKQKKNKKQKKQQKKKTNKKPKKKKNQLYEDIFLKGDIPDARLWFIELIKKMISQNVFYRH